MAGGLGAFFLLTEPPERFGLPAAADSPIQENGPVANLSGFLAAAAGLLGVMASVRWSHR
jgi:formate dehydrogenase iron-sulfur subunit